MARYGEIWQDMTRGKWKDLIRFDNGDMARFGKI